eukprot:4384345-Pyramimonas_sp.AAC.1
MPTASAFGPFPHPVLEAGAGKRCTRTFWLSLTFGPVDQIQIPLASRGCTSGPRTVQLLRGLLGASLWPLGGVLGGGFLGPLG